MRYFRISLGWKMAVTFAVFGFLISWLCLVLDSTRLTAEIVDSVEATLRATTLQLLPERSNAGIERLKTKGNPVLRNVLNSVKPLPTLESSIVSIVLCLRRADEPGRWSAVYSDAEGRLRLLEISPNEGFALERALEKRGKGGLPPVFFGFRDNAIASIDLSRPGDEWILAAKVLLSRESGISQVSKYSGLFLGGIMAWLFIWLVLSHFIGSRLAKPILELAEQMRARDYSQLPVAVSRHDEIGSLARTMLEMNSTIEAEKRELEDRARVLESMNRIDRAVLEGKGKTILLGKVLSAVLDYSSGVVAGIAVRDPDGGGFDVISTRRTRMGDGGTPLPPIAEGFSMADVPGAEALHTGFIGDDEILPDVLVRYSDCFELKLAELGQAFSERLGLDPGADLNFVNLPFDVTGFYTGSLIIIRKEGGPPVSTLSLLADQAGVALKDLETREEGNRNWLGMMHSLVRAVDAKSAWTRGHSERVGCLSLAVGRRLLMDEKELSTLEMAAVLHDVGKIGVPEAILDKPGRLDDKEMEAVRKHPVIGAGIVEDLPSYAAVRGAILYHHERWDGTGYPDRLSGENIPFFARIIALADVYDAITDDRPYRHGMSPSEAQDFIAKGSGNLFDPRLARIFIETVMANDAMPSGQSMESA